MSIQLNDWIDLNFGYLLSSPFGIEAKNIPLKTESPYLKKEASFLQLFSEPHPKKRVNNNEE